MDDHKFAPAAASESIVHGASGPRPPIGQDDNSVNDWIAFMKARGTERVCCLLDRQVNEYDDLLGTYSHEFGDESVCRAPIADYDAVEPTLFFERISPFLKDADRAGEPVVVHCSAGLGRTGHVLVLWLVTERRYGIEEAISTVETTGRLPLEAVRRDELRTISERAGP